VELLIYVFDIESEEQGSDFSQFADVIEAVEQHSPDARVYVLVHKMDLVKEDVRKAVFSEKEASILSQSSDHLRIQCFRTSIWDETLYRAWSHIVYSLVPNTALLESHLNEYCTICGADEVVLFESTTFLVIAHATCIPHSDTHRFEKISNIIKQFKLSCRKVQAHFEGMLVQHHQLIALFENLTRSTAIMFISSDPDLMHTALISSNVAQFRAQLKICGLIG
jgi:Ras-related GTP-binding protein A/B